jgi:flagellar export protein FliJ
VTNKERLSRIQRLVNIRERTRDSAQSALAEAKRKADSARQAHMNARENWDQECDGTNDDSPVASVRDFAERRSHLHTLHRKADRAAVKRQRSEVEEASRLEEATDAHKELRKMEVWNDNETKRIQEETNRRDQQLTDEIAAQRTARRS